MRRPISLKSNTCTESMGVYVAGISGKDRAHYPGRSAGLLRATAVVRRQDEPAEVSRGHSSPTATRDEGPNRMNRKESIAVRTGRKAEERAQMLSARAEGGGRNRPEQAQGVYVLPRATGSSDPEAQALLEQIVAPENMRRAWRQVKRNKGEPGVDGRTIDETASLLRQYWNEIRERLLDGSYQPQPVLRVEIPKPGGGSSLEAQFSGLQLYQSPEAEDTGAGEECEAISSEPEGAVSLRTGTESGPVHNRDA